MATVAITTRPSKRADGRETVYVRVHHKAKTRYLSLGLTVAPSRWNDARSEFRRTHPQHRRLNAYLAEVRADAEAALTEILTSGEVVTAAAIKRRIRAQLEPEAAEGPKDFIAYSEGLLSTWRGQWAYQTMLAYQTAVNKLGEFAGGKALPFARVTPALCRRFQEWLREEKGNSVNTQHKNLSTLKGFYRQAMEDEVIPWGRNPFDALTLRKETGRKDKLTSDELREMLAVELDERSLLADVRRWFFFAFYAGGMRFSDVAELKRRHIEQSRSADGGSADGAGEVRVRYRMGKTKDLHSALLVEDAVEILEYYGWQEKGPGERVFPILDGYDLSTPKRRRQSISSRNALVNKYLKKLTARAGVKKKVSFHIARHSTAGYLLEQGHSVRTIQKVLGHGSSRTTEQYLEGFKSSGPDEASRSLGL